MAEPSSSSTSLSLSGINGWKMMELAIFYFYFWRCWILWILHVEVLLRFVVEIWVILCLYYIWWKCIVEFCEKILFLLNSKFGGHKNGRKKKWKKRHFLGFVLSLLAVLMLIVLVWSGEEIVAFLLCSCNFFFG